VSLAVALLMVVAGQQPAGADSVLALRQARQLLVEQYKTVNVHFLDRQCRGVGLDDCWQGDWSCIDFTCPSDLTERRATLIRNLEHLAPEAGNSEWLFRQRVALAVKNGELERAHAIAETCSGMEWWCMTLRGFTEHRLRPGSGVTDFDSAFSLLERHPRRLPDGRFAWGLGPTARCTWSDVRAVVPADLLSNVLEWSCPKGNERRERFWWLADPLWVRPGNERYLEHLARQVMVRMDLDVLKAVAEADSEPGVEDWMWQDVDLYSAYALAFRQGFPNSRRVMQNPAQTRMYFGYRGTAPYVHGGYSFVPDRMRYLEPVKSTANDWAVEWQPDGCAAPWADRAMEASRTPSAEEWLGQGEELDRCGMERLITRETWHNLEHQVAEFRRGGQLLFVAAAPLPDELGPSEKLQPALAIGRVDDRSIRTTEAAIDLQRTFRSRMVTDSGNYVISIEVVGPDHIGRARLGALAQPLDNGFGVSDLALVEARFVRDSLGLEHALLPSLHFSQVDRVGVYLEVYGTGPAEPLNVTLTAEKTKAGLLTRIGRKLRLTSAERAVEISWADQADETGQVRRIFFELTLDELGKGERRLKLAVERANGTEAEATRIITVH